MEWIDAKAELPEIGKYVIFKWIKRGRVYAYRAALYNDTEYGVVFATWDNYVDPLHQDCYWLKED
jgi:hypothetical protein